MTASLLLPLLLLLAASVGFVAHRASLCSVKAVEELFTTRQGYMLLSFLKVVLWVLAVSLAVVWLWPEGAAVRHGWNLTGQALLGGAIFGVGAVVNGGCAVSTLTRLGAGNLGMLVSLLGMALGIAAGLQAERQLALPPRQEVPVLIDAVQPWAETLLVILALWALYEVVQLLRRRPRDLRLGQRLRAQRYRLSTAALVMGLSNGALYALAGSWAYTSTLAGGVRDLVGFGDGPGALLWGLFGALLVGVALSAWESGAVRLAWRPERRWALFLGGGILMGFGAAWAPGGNDVLILQAVPSLSPHGAPALLAMFAAIALTLGLARLMGMSMPRVDCAGDLCRN